MAENAGIVWTGNAAAAVTADYVDWVNYALEQVGSHYWTVATPINGTGTTRKLHIECTATGAQAVLIASTNVLQVAYAAGTITDPYGTPASASAYMGIRNVFGYTSNITLHGTRLALAEYEDALALFIYDDSNTIMRIISHFGKVLEYTDASDEALGIGGHGFISGRPRKEGSTGYWMVANNSGVYTGNTQCFQNSPTSFDSGSISITYNAGNGYLNSIGALTRLVPQPISFIVGTSTLDSFAGYTKYIRLYKSNLYQDQTFESTTPGSNQAWYGWIEKATATSTIVNTNPNTCTVMLWSKSPTAI